MCTKVPSIAQLSRLLLRLPRLLLQHILLRVTVSRQGLHQVPLVTTQSPLCSSCFVSRTCQRDMLRAAAWDSGVSLSRWLHRMPTAAVCFAPRVRQPRGVRQG